MQERRPQGKGLHIQGPEGGAGLSMNTGRPGDRRAKLRGWERSVSDRVWEDESECVTRWTGVRAGAQRGATGRGRSRQRFGKATKISASPTKSG